MSCYPRLPWAPVIKGTGMFLLIRKDHLDCVSMGESVDRDRWRGKSLVLAGETVVSHRT